jgi:hypothetical protein
LHHITLTMLAPLLSPVPAINIELAAEQMPLKEPSSPFDKLLFSAVTANIDTYRSNHLLPPPVHSPKDHLRPTVTNQATRSLGLGLDAARFEALKIASKASPNTHLRKELAIRAHQSNQSEYPPSICLPLHHEGPCSQTIHRRWLPTIRRPCTDGHPFMFTCRC